jgi:phage terminase large subunit
MTQEEELRALVKLLEERQKFEQNFPLLLFPAQRNFIEDKTKRKAALCSRRSGKTIGIALDLCRDIRNPIEGDCAYIGLTRATSKKILFNQIEKLNKKHKLRLEFNRTDLSIQSIDTENTLYITGANTEDEAEKLRGLKLKRAVLDEVASFRAHVNYLIEEVLEPTLIDCNGNLDLIGTPSANPTPDSLFYKVTTGQESGWAVHKWTLLDNPFIPHAKTWLEDYRTRKQWSLDHPIYLREWCGEWTFDESSLVYKYNDSRNNFDNISVSDQQYVIGVDLGFDDAFAIVVNCFSFDSRQIWTEYEFKRSGLIPEQMAAKIKEVQDRYTPVRTVADYGGLGKAICEEFNRRYGLQIHPAEKSKKAAYIEMANGDLLSGVWKIRKESMLATEMKAHQWDPDRPGKEDDRTANDLCDAALYSWRECKHFLGEVKERMPEVGTKEWFDHEAKVMLEREMEDFNNRQNQEVI